MAVDGIWSSTKALAEVWSASDVVQQLCEQLPRNNSSTHGIPELLRNIDAGVGLVSSEPLLPNKWVLFVPQLPFVNMEDKEKEFLSRMDPIGFAAELTTAWLRSRLPGYPLIPVPQLVSNTHLTSVEIGSGIGWRKEALNSGLQYLAAPPHVADLIGVDARSLTSAIRELASHLESSREWQVFGSLMHELSQDDRSELSHARKRLRPLLSDEAVSRFEPVRMLRRNEYRKNAVDEVLQTLTGRPLDLARAFDDVCDLIDLASVIVLGQLVAYGDPFEVVQASKVERAYNTIKFESSDPIPRFALVRLSHPLAPDCALVERSTISFGEVAGTVCAYEARVLVNSGSFS